MSSTASSSTSTSTSIPSPFPSDPSSIPDALTAEEECRLLRSIFPRSVLDTANSPQESSGCCQLPFDFPLGSIPTSPFILIDDDAFNTSFKALQGDPRNVLCYSLERSPGRISFLRIRNVALNITTPSQLAALTRLKHLEISNASLTGPIPDSWGTFPMLENLYLVQNQFNAPLNPALAQLPRLQNFYVHSSGLTGEIHPAFSRVFGTNGTMVRFDISNNAMTGSIPDFIWNGPNLSHLSLARNSFTGPLPTTAPNLPKLQTLYLHNLPLSSPFSPYLLSLPSLKQLVLFRSLLTGDLPSIINQARSLLSGRMSSLQTLDLAWNNFTGGLPAGLTTWGSLVSLDVSGNALGGDLPVEWGDGLKGLEVMRMAWCGLTGKYPEAWVGMEKLTELILNRNNLTGFLPTFTKNLTIVDISHNDFSGEIPESFVNAWGLVSLDIGWNRIWGRIPSSWRLRVDSGVLKSFSIGYNQLIGIVPPFVSMAPQFNISGNCFTLPPNVHDAFPQNDSTRLIPQFSNCPLSSDSKPVPSSNPPTLAIALSVTATLIFAILLAAAFIIIRRRRRTREAKIETPNLISSYIDTPRSSTTTSTPSSKAEESSLFSNLAHRTPSQRWISTPSSAAGSVKGEPSALFGNLERGSVSGSLVVPLMKTVEGDCADWGVEEVEGWLENSGVNKNISTMFVASGITGRALLNLDDVALRDMGFAQDEVRSMILLMVYALKNKRQGGLMVDGPPAYNGDEESVVGSSVLVEASEGKTDTVVSSEMGRGMTVGSSVGVSEMGRSETVTSSELWRAVTVGSSVSGSELGTGTVVSEVGRSESVPSVEALEESESGSAGRMETLVTEAEDRTEIARVDTRVVGVKNIEEINGMSRGVSDLVVQSPDVSAVTTSRD